MKLKVVCWCFIAQHDRNNESGNISLVGYKSITIIAGRRFSYILSSLFEKICITLSFHVCILRKTSSIIGYHHRFSRRVVKRRLMMSYKI